MIVQVDFASYLGTPIFFAIFGQILFLCYSKVQAESHARKVSGRILDMFGYHGWKISHLPSGKLT
jgi:hypothetical protein